MSREHRTGSAMSLRDAAYVLRISERKYIDIEKDRAPPDGLIRLRVANITTGERCLLARRRSGLSLRKVYKDIGVSRPKFHELEKIGDLRVISYWRNHGFRFPRRSEAYS
jgi:DNA-binding XRE family transcriptional regulator